MNLKNHEKAEKIQPHPLLSSPSISTLRKVGVLSPHLGKLKKVILLFVYSQSRKL